MVTAQVTITREQLLSITQPAQFIGIDWETYEAIADELGESRPVVLTFQKGILTLMPLSEIHELLKTILHDFVRFAGLSSGINIVATGSATLRSRTKSIGVEPDLSYYVTKAGSHRVSRFVGAEPTEVPDIVIEIDISHRSDDKFSIYAELGVPEFWLYNGEVLLMHSLAESGQYSRIGQSREVPILRDSVLTEFLNRAYREEEQVVLLREFQEWLQASK